MTSKVINSKVRLLIKYLSDSLISKLTDVFGEAKSLNVTLIPGSATLMKIVSLIRMSLQFGFRSPQCQTDKTSLLCFLYIWFNQKIELQQTTLLAYLF